MRPFLEALKSAVSLPLSILAICWVMSSVYCFEAYAAPTLQLNSTQHQYHLDEHIEYLEDKSGQLDITSIRQQPETAWKKPIDSDISFGFSDSAYWLRFSIEISEPQSWLLEIDSPLLDEISFYLYAGGELLQEVQTGDARPFVERPLKFREFIFPLRLPPSEQTNLYLRVKSSGSVQVPMHIWQEASFYQRDESETALLGLYCGAILVMLFYNLFIYLRVYEPAYIYYVLYVMMFGLFTVGLTGWGYKHLWPEAVNFQQYGLAIFIILGGIFVCRFIHHFLDLPHTAPRIGHLLTGAAVILLIDLLLLPLLSYQIVVQIALVMTMAISLIALYTGVLLWQQGEIAARYFTIAWSAFLIAVLFATLEKFGVLPLWIWAEVLLPAGMALEVILLSLALAERINSEKQNRLQAQQEVIEIQLKHQEELEHKVAERTVDLEEANAKLEVLAITDGLTGIFNHRYFLERGSNAIKIAQRYQRPVALIMLDIDHFKLINDTYGHAVGDIVLKHVVSICSSVNRETDIFGRLGGEEFGILLLETPASSAYTVAERLRCEIETSPIDHEGTSITVTASLGVRPIESAKQYPTIEEMLKVADDALYRAKEAGRNKVVMSPGSE